MIKKVLFFSIFTILFFISCSAPKISYFQDFGNGTTEIVNFPVDLRLQPDDKITIVVNSKDPVLAELFNLPIYSRRVGTQQSSINTSQQMSVYTVDPKGEIDFPVLGNIRVEGLRRDELALLVKTQLINRNLVKDPVVTVEYANFSFNVLGEVNRPGRYNFDRDHMNILDAISMAGDLTIQGKRETVMVIRESKGKCETYRVNLESGRELLQSPAFYLQQNDVVYVEPNDYRSRQTMVNGNNVLAAPFWISVASFLTSIAVLIFK